MVSSRWAIALSLLVLLLARGVRAQSEATRNLPWIVFVRVSNAPPGSEARLAAAVGAALLRSEANVVETKELVKAAGSRGVARARWADVGSLNQVAQDIGADFLLFASVRSSELELFTLSRTGEIGGTERVSLGRRASPPAAAELDLALARLLAKLPSAPATPGANAVAASPSPPPPTSPTPDPASATPTAAPAAGAIAAAQASTGSGPSTGEGAVSGVKIGLLVGAGVLGTAAGCMAAFGVVTGMNAMDQSNALLSLPKDSPIRVEGERASLDTAVIADVSHGTAAVLIGAAVGVAVWAMVIE